jgi:hypothetical protein
MLTRGDRYLTTEFTRKWYFQHPAIKLLVFPTSCHQIIDNHSPAFNLTTWGFNDCKFDPDDGSYGGMLTKLLYRTLPDYFPASSAYAHFPFLVPSYLKDYLVQKNDKTVNNYTWTRPGQPSSTITIDTYVAVNEIVTDSSFMSSYNDKIFNIVKTSFAVCRQRLSRLATLRITWMKKGTRS